MAEMAQSGRTIRAEDLLGDLKVNWGWLMGLGILFLILGIVGLGQVFFLTVASVMFFGFLLLIGGVAQLVEAFKCKGWKGMIWHILIALLYIFAGITAINRPLVASTLITLMIAGAIIAIGLMRIIVAFQHRGTSGWIWPLLGGVISLLLGLMIIARWPVSGLWVIGLFLAIELITNGWSYIMIALAAKNAVASEPAASAVG